MRILAVTNMYPTPNAPHSGIFVEQQIAGLRQLGVEVDLMLVDRLGQGMRCYVGLSERVKRRLDLLRHSIVHVMYGGIMSDIVTRAASRTPKIVTFHGSDLLGEHLSGPVRRMLADYGVWASWRAARRADRVVTVANALIRALPMDVDRRKVHTIPCGIDLGRFKPLDRLACQSELGWPDNKFHVLFPANGGDPVKRFELAQAAVGVLDPSGISVELHQLRGIDNRDVPVWLNASDVLLLTSRHEGSPTVVKEALACNVPVVSVDVGDVRERLMEVPGCYLATDHPEDLAAKLALVQAASRRVDGRSTVAELSLDSIAARLKQLYEEIAPETNQRSESAG